MSEQRDTGNCWKVVMRCFDPCNMKDVEVKVKVKGELKIDELAGDDQKE